MTTKLLVPFDGSPAASRAVDLLAGYAGETAALAAVLLNVQTRPVSLWPGAGLSAGAIDAALLDGARRTLEPAALRLHSAGIAAEAQVRLGMAAEVILREAAAAKADAVVMGTRGGGALHGFALGSVALRVAHGDGPPVILVKPDDRLPAGFGKRLRVLIALDGSAPALRAAERLVAWRGWLGELEVHLAYVQRPLTVLEHILPPHDDVLGQWSTQEGREATQAARELFRSAGIEQHLHLTVGDPALELRTLAAQTSSDLVVLGTRGLGATHHALVGSVALKTAALSGVPVLLVP
ncbi:MAG TPA: universal stress protein [Burkholderiales bacterium]|nr:universal stress protein [Burkholderiales bacterium]